jgi:hypothetical protein
VGWSSGGIYGTQSWGYVAGIMGQLRWIQFRTISAVSTLLYPPPYSIPSPVVSVVAMAVAEVPGTYFTLRFSLRFTNLSLLRFPFTLSVLIRFLPLLRTISTIPDTPLPPPYSIPSPVISVVAMAVTEVLAYTSILYL